MSMAEITDCSVCYESFVQPKMLPCQHTYCLNCLRRLGNGGRITCPQCRAQHWVPPSGVDGFPNNILMMSLLSSTGKEKLPCKECNSGRYIEKNCEHCGRYLCVVCRLRHVQEVIDKMDSDMGTFKYELRAFNKQVEEINKRKKQAKTLENQIKEWEKRCVEELHHKTKKFIAEVYSRLQPNNARDMTAEIIEFQRKFATRIMQATGMSVVLEEQEKLKGLKKRSAALASALENSEKLPFLKFDLGKAESVFQSISSVQSVVEVIPNELWKSRWPGLLDFPRQLD